MKAGLKTAIIFLIFALTLAEEYTKFPFTIEAEDCDGVQQVWTSVYENKIKGDFSGKGFAYLQGQEFSFKLISYQYNCLQNHLFKNEIV